MVIPIYERLSACHYIRITAIILSAFAETFAHKKEKEKQGYVKVTNSISTSVIISRFS